MDAPNDPADNALSALIERLHQRGRLRVWSLVITLFGDAVVPRGGEAPLSGLQDVMARLGVEAGALRTALSRLAGDGWVVRERRGRNSFFSLDKRGRHAFDLATRRIYAAAPPAWDGSWTVAVLPPDMDNGGAEALAERGFLKIANSVHLLPRTLELNDRDDALLAEILLIHGTSAEHPEMLRTLWPSEEIAGAYASLIEDYRPFADALSETGLKRPVDAMAARTLLIHDWRRIVLRDPGLPTALLPQDWPGEEARALVRNIYRKLAARSEEWLDITGLPPVADPKLFGSRFGG